eukprot:Gregarina_sp_Pseudo_9__1642@NODE_2103_length_1148_cov_116_592426_g1941_i0_p2_GENE_NODE_2103_length_1148_cov_116_592426_g1941_i0NODE_2103_length_1148_cov_116_592426_g1941_i0_p2_ORF_typecomplete_len184_score32_65Ctr/PF04145_15/7_2e22DUF1129/PF06570_11/0_095DUF2207/PF09972_9/0_33HisKA_4TM/PF16926_5/10_NODE_2103_length_1148_cov_116_592426_g1941_i0423974
MDEGGMPMVHQMVMQMTFINSPKVTLLWKGWTTETYKTYIPSLFALVAIGIATVYLKAFRVELDRKLKKLVRWKAGAIRAGLAVVSLVLEYCLMLCVMTYNVGVFLAVVAGVGVGVGLFSGSHMSVGRTPKEGDEFLLDATLATPDYCDCPCSQSVHPKIKGVPPTASARNIITDLDPSCCPP